MSAPGASPARARPLTFVRGGAQNRPPCGPRSGVNPVEIHEYLVLKYDGKVARFPVFDGDVAQAKVRASLCQLPGDCLVLVTDDAYIRLKPEVPAGQPSNGGGKPTGLSGQ
jgi:hypothetical protein